MINNTDPRSFSRCPIAVRDTSTRWSTSDSLPAKGPGISNAPATSIGSFIGSYPRSTDPWSNCKESSSYNNWTRDQDSERVRAHHNCISL